MAPATRLLFVALASALLAAPVRAAEPPGKSLPPPIARTEGVFSLSVTGEYTTGDYGSASTTDIWYFPVMFRYETERTAWRITVPYLIVEGTGDVVVSADGGHSAGHVTTSTSSYSESGLGDIILSGTYVLLPEGDATPAVGLTGKIKLATADETRGLGAGENDYAAEVEFVKSREQFTGFGGVGYKIMGDPPGFDFNNVFYGFLGAEYRFDNLRTGGVVLDVAQATTAAGSDLRQLTAYLARKIDKTLLVRGYLILGLSDGGPERGIGVGAIYYWR
jgi:hypothetical protein